MLTSPEILVPIDFSPCSVNALRVAVGMAAPEGDLTLLHVVDEDFIQAAVAAGMISCQVRSASSPSTKVCWVAVKSLILTEKAGFPK